MTMIDQRAALARLIEERKEGFAGLSRLLGKNPAYVQQFIKRGTPRRLDAEDVRILAEYFGIPEAELGGRPPERREEALVRVPRYDVGASAGHGAYQEEDGLVANIAFDPRWLRQLCGRANADLSFIRVQGDSMVPTLADGDDILVDRSDGADRLRDGIYVLKRDDSLMVKRIAPSPAGRSVTIKSDNPTYPEWRDCERASLEIIGRVIWAGHWIF